VQFLDSLTTLTTLILRGCSLITDQGVQSLASLTALTTLNLQACRLITDQGVQSLASLTALTTLNLDGCSLITDKGVQSLASNLTSITPVTLWFGFKDRRASKEKKNRTKQTSPVAKRTRSALQCS
jgi:hypothetical protein